MKKLIVLMVLLLTLSMPLASADVVTDLEVKVNEYNENADKLPSFLKSILGNEVIKLVITANDGSEIYIKAVTEDAYVTSFEVVDADTEIGETIVIETNEVTVQAIMNSEDPLTTFLEAMDSGNLVIDPVGLMNNITFTVASIVLKLSQILGLV